MFFKKKSALMDIVPRKSYETYKFIVSHIPYVSGIPKAAELKKRKTLFLYPSVKTNIFNKFNLLKQQMIMQNLQKQNENKIIISAFSNYLKNKSF